MNAQRWDILLVEWLWTREDLSVYSKQGRMSNTRGGNVEAVQLLAKLGDEGWEVATCTAGGDRVLWTLKKPLT